MEIPLLGDVVILLGFAVLVILLFNYLKLPNVLGLLLTGIIVGPHGLSLIDATHEVEILAEIGVVLLLFVIGLEFSLQSLMAIKKVVLVAGTIQVFGTVLVAIGVFTSIGYAVNLSIFLGFLFSLSSTAIVLKLLQDKGEMDSPHGRISLAVLIFQDVVVVMFMLLTPILAGKGGNVTESILLMIGKAAFVIALVVLGARFVVPQLLYQVVRTKSKDLFVITIVVLCFSVAYLTFSFGLSLALGAFMAGLVISESEYSHQATGNILPFRELFTSFFFISIGMLLDMQFLIYNLHWIVLFTLLVSIIKFSVASLAALALRYPPRTVFMVGLSLFQVGEFAFILSAVGISNELLTPELYQYFLSVSITTMAITPFVFMYSEKMVDLLFKFPLSGRLKNSIKETNWKASKPETTHGTLTDHIIIVGFGLNGRNVALAASHANIPYAILEINPDTVNREKKNGEPIYYGDASNNEVLNHLNVQQARVVVVAISDPVATKNAIVNIRAITQVPHIIIRTRFVHEINENLKLGANDVIPEEFETSIEIFTRVLNKYLVPQSDIEQFINHIRARNYEMLRPISSGTEGSQPMQIPDLNMACIKIKGKNPDVVGHTLADSGVRQKFGVTIVALVQQGDYTTNIMPDTVIQKGDTLYVLGQPSDITAFEEAVND